VSESLAHWNRLLGTGLTLHALPVDASGRHRLDILRDLAPRAAMVCTMAANNETGTISDLDGIARVLVDAGGGAYWMVDCVQALGKLPLDLANTRIDYAPFSGHKLHAPKGIGMLYVRDGAPYTPLMIGGGQEGGQRSGTENMAGIAALGAVLAALEEGTTFRTHAELAVSFLPARTIGGDLYDFLEYSPDQTAIVLGDVSGKAAPAALFAALVSGIMRSAAQQKPAPAAMLETLNHALQERRLDSQYVVMLFALWNDENQTLQVANSGAVQPIFCRAGENVTVKAEGLPLGMFPNSTYEEFNVATQPGDAIVFVSDGILDAENEKHEMYGEERLAALLCASRDLPAQHIAATILSDVTQFQGSQDRFDDETIIVLRVR